MHTAAIHTARSGLTHAAAGVATATPLNSCTQNCMVSATSGRGGTEPCTLPPIPQSTASTLVGSGLFFMQPAPLRRPLDHIGVQQAQLPHPALPAHAPARHVPRQRLRSCRMLMHSSHLWVLLCAVEPKDERAALVVACCSAAQAQSACSAHNACLLAACFLSHTQQHQVVRLITAIYTLRCAACARLQVERSRSRCMHSASWPPAMHPCTQILGHIASAN